MKPSFFARLRKKKSFRIFMYVLAALVVFRIFLPTLVKGYVNRALSKIPDYQGQVSDIDISLLRGAYTIKGLTLKRIKNSTDIPFLTIPRADISVEWKSLLHGEIVSEIYLTEPTFMYVRENMSEKDKATKDDWSRVLTDLVPIDINHLQITNGAVAFKEITRKPAIDIYMNKLSFTADNLRNIILKNNQLPSTVFGEASSIGNGKMSMKGKMNLIKEVPDLDIELSIQEIGVPALNDVTKNYGNFDFEKGDMGVFLEMAIADKYLKGNSKIMLKDFSLINREESGLKNLWEGFLEFFGFILRNQKTKTLAMRVPFEGDLSNVETDTWSTILSIFKNAFVKAFESNVDNLIEYKDVISTKDKQAKKD